VKFTHAVTWLILGRGHLHGGVSTIEWVGHLMASLVQKRLTRVGGLPEHARDLILCHAFHLVM